MTIKNMDLYVGGVWDWGMFDDIFPGKMRMGDVDGIIERNGRALMMEAKRPGVSVPKGQSIMFTNLAKSGYISTIVVWGDANQPEAMQVYAAGKAHPKRPATTADVRQAVAQWFAWASKQPKPE